MSISFLDIPVLGLPTLEDGTVALSRNVASQKPTESQERISYPRRSENLKVSGMYQLNISVRQVSVLLWTGVGDTYTFVGNAT
jgi:hypothetical protein